MNKKEREAWENAFGEDWEKRHFTERGNSPDWWIHSAGKLLAVVRLIGQSVDAAHGAAIEHGRKLNGRAKVRFRHSDELRAVQPLAMIRAMALECLLKALLVKTKGPMVEGNRVVRWKTHDLPKLAREAGLELSEHESIVLEKLTLRLTTNGRYPIGLQWDYDRNVRKRTGELPPTSTWTLEDIKVCTDLLAQLEAMCLP